MAREVDIAALGELLIDFTEAGYSKDGMNYSSRIQAEHRQICLPLPVTWAIKRHLSEKSEQICMVLF